MQLFSVAKIPTYCEGIAHRIERRKSGDVKVVDLTLRVDPFNTQLASALDQDEYGFVKRMIFKMNDGEPVRDLRSIEFKPPTDRQNIACYAAPDTEAGSICFTQAKVTKMRVRSQKDGNRWVLYLYVSFGPVGKSELEYVNAFYTEQRFLSWDASEPLLDFEPDDDADDLTDADVKAQQPAPMWDDEPPVAAAAAEKPEKKKDRKNVNRKLHVHGAKRKKSRR